MADPTWVLERDVFARETFDAVLAALRETGTRHHAVYVTDGRVVGRPPQIDGPCIVYGAIGVRELSKRYGWEPGVFGEEAAFSAGGHLGDLMLNASAEVMPLSAVGSYLDSGEWRTHDQFFLKPEDDNKAFAGLTLTPADFPGWLERLQASGYLGRGDFNVVLAPAQKLGWEWRVVMVAGEPVAASSYRLRGLVNELPGCPAEVEAFAREAHRRYAPASVYVIDVAEVLGAAGEPTELKVVEHNTFNSASLYACPAARVVEAVTTYVRQGGR